MKEGEVIPISQTLPDVNLDEILSALDSDTRDYLLLLLNDGAQGLGSEQKGKELSAAIRRLEPTAKYAREINEGLAERRRNLARVVHNFSLLTDELGQRDTQLANFVQNNNAVFDTLAGQDASLRQILQKLPGTLRTTQTTLGKVKGLADELGPTLDALDPAAKALAPSLRQTRPFLRQSTPVIRDEIRPFTRAALPTVQELRPAMRDLAAATPDLTESFSVLNRLLNEIAYNPPGDKEEGYLFWQSWVNHAGNAIFSTQDAHGPIRRGLVVLSCSTAQLLDSVAQANPQLGTLVELLNAPRTGADLSDGPGAAGGDVTGELMVKDAPSFGKIAAMVLFALSCFGLLLFLWLAFGGTVPLKPKGYRFHTSFAEAGQLALEADVRISGVPVGKVKTIKPDKVTGRADVEIQLKSRYAPLPSDVKAILRQKTLLGETYVELTPGRNSAKPIPEGGELPSSQVSDTVELDEILRAFDPKTRVAFQDWMQTQAQAISGRGRDLNDALGNLGAVRRGHGGHRLDPQQAGGRGLAPDRQHRGRVRGAVGARRAAALAGGEHELRVRDDRLAGQRAPGRVPGAADVREGVAADVQPARRVRARDRPADHAAAARGARALADAARPAGHLAGPAQPARAAAAADRRIQGGLPGGREDARGPAAAGRPARPGDGAARAGGRIHRVLQARADVVLRQHRGGDAGHRPADRRALPAHQQPAEPGEPRGLSEAAAVQPAEPVPAAGRLRRAQPGVGGLREPPVRRVEPDAERGQHAAAARQRRHRRPCRPRSRRRSRRSSAA